MAKAKPQRKNRVAAAVYEETISNENIIQRKIRKAQETITLVDINDIKELTCEDGTIMYNRITYPSNKLKELSEDIKDLNNKNTGILGTGILNPVMLRNNNGNLERIHGSNRIQAAQMAGLTQVPAVILDNVSDIIARQMRTSENMNRSDLNPYDETVSVLEYLKMACGFETINNVKSFINKIKNHSSGKVSLNEEEQTLYKNISEIFEKSGKYDVASFSDRLGLLNLNPLIIQALKEEIIGYTQAKVIKTNLYKDEDIIKIIDILKNNKMSVSKLREEIKNILNQSNDKIIIKRGLGASKTYNQTLNKIYKNSSEEDKKVLDKKIEKINKLYISLIEEFQKN